MVFCVNSGMQNAQQPPPTRAQHAVNFLCDTTKDHAKQNSSVPPGDCLLIQRSWKVRTMSNSFCVSSSSLLFSTNLFSAVL